MASLKFRPATREEILGKYEGQKVSYETYVREVNDSRTEHGVRHIRQARSTVRNVGGVPTVRRLAEDFELFASVYELEGCKDFIACPTIIKP